MSYSGKNRLSSNRAEQWVETVNWDHDIHPQAQEEGSSEVVCQRDGSPNPAAEAPSIIEKDNECLSKKAPTFVIEFANTLLRGSKKRDGRTTSRLVIFLSYLSSKLKRF